VRGKAASSSLASSELETTIRLLQFEAPIGPARLNVALWSTFLRADLDPNRGTGASEVESLPVVVITFLVHADLILTGPQAECGLAGMVGPSGGSMPASVIDGDVRTCHGRDQTSDRATDDVYLQSCFSRLSRRRRTGSRRFPSAEHDSS